MKLYVASSWRNEKFDAVLHQLDKHSIPYYNFRDGNENFRWKEIDLNWEDWTATQMILALTLPQSELAFKNDFDAMKECDACLLVHPCGRSAHLEAGWFVGQGKPVYVLLDNGDPELMLKMVDLMTANLDDIIQHVLEVQNESK